MRIVTWFKHLCNSLLHAIGFAFQLIVGYFMLNRDCNQCEHKNLITWEKTNKRQWCVHYDKCYKSITYYCFKRRVGDTE